MSNLVECPLCGEQAETATFSMGDSWRDVVGKPPHSLFSEYPMVHAGPTEDGMALFLHPTEVLQR